MSRPWVLWWIYAFLTGSPLRYERVLRILGRSSSVEDAAVEVQRSLSDVWKAWSSIPGSSTRTAPILGTSVIPFRRDYLEVVLRIIREDSCTECSATWSIVEEI